MQQNQIIHKDNQEAGAASETVLLAEDDRLVRMMLAKVLSSAGYGVLEAGDGRTAVKIFLENHDEIDILLFDYAMPEMNGKEAYREIQSHVPETKVIFMSGYVMDEEVRADIGREFPFMPKPIRRKELLKLIRDVLDNVL